MPIVIFPFISPMYGLHQNDLLRPSRRKASHLTSRTSSILQMCMDSIIMTFDIQGPPKTGHFISSSSSTLCVCTPRKLRTKSDVRARPGKRRISLQKDHAKRRYAQALTWVAYPALRAYMLTSTTKSRGVPGIAAEGL